MTTPPGPSPEALLREIATLNFRLEEAQSKLEAIRSRAVDALECAERPYHEVVDRMTEGATRGEQARMLAESQRIAKIGSWQYDFHDPILWSDETYRIYGVDPATFTPGLENLFGLIHPEDRPALEAWQTACAAGEPVGELVFRRILPDGTLR